MTTTHSKQRKRITRSSLRDYTIAGRDPIIARPKSWIDGIDDAKLTARLKDPPRISPEAFSSDDDAPPVRYLRPPRTPEHEPDDDDNEPAPPFTWVPDIGAQIDLATSAHLGCPSASEIAQVRTAIVRMFSFGFANPDVRISCNNGVLSVAIWRSTVTGDRNNDSRDLGLARLGLLNPGQSFGIFLHASLISELAARGFNSLPTHRFSESGRPDPTGPIHIQSLSVRLVESAVVQTVLEGFDDRTTPDVDFTLTISDSLSAHGNTVQCDTSQDLDIDDWDAFLAGLLGVLLVAAAAFVPYLVPIPAFVIANDLDAILGSDDAASGQASEGGVGCMLRALLPQSIPLPTPNDQLAIRSRIDLLYRRVHVTSGGVFFFGIADLRHRDPVVRIIGPDSLVVFDDDAQTHASFRAEPTDTFGAVSFVWSSPSPGVHIASPNAESTVIRFDRGQHDAGARFDRLVAVTITDEDRVLPGEPAISASHTVHIHVQASDDDEAPPPVCRAKPWTPSCQRQ